MSLKQKMAYVVYYASIVWPIYDIIVGVVKGIHNGIKAIREEVKLVQEKADIANPQNFEILSFDECRKIFDDKIVTGKNFNERK